MSNTGLKEFDNTIQKTNQLLKDIEVPFGWEKRRNQSYAALKAVLHALRDRLTIDETAQFASQLPMLVKGIYYEGWDPSKVPVKMNREQFLQRIRQEFPFSMEEDIEELVKVVFIALNRFVSIGELEDIRVSLPKDIREEIVAYG